MASNPLKVLVELQAKKGVVVSGSNNEGLLVQNSASIGGDLAVTGISTLTGDVSVSGALAVTGSATLKGAAYAQNGLQVTNAALNASTVAVSASALNVSGAAYVGTDLTVQGNLKVYGNVDAISSSNLQVADKLIIAAVGAATNSDADGGGFFLSGSSAEFKYASNGDKWTMNKALHINGAISGSSTAMFASDATIGGDLTLVGDLSSSAGNAAFGGTLDVDGAATLNAAVTANDGITVSSGSLIASGSAIVLGGLNVKDTGLTVEAGGVTVTGAVSSSSGLNTAGNLSVQGTGFVSGAFQAHGIATFDAAVSASAGMKVTGASQLSGAVTMNSNLAVEGNTVMTGTLGVTGAATLEDSLTVNGGVYVEASGSLVNIPDAAANGLYDVAKAIKLLDGFAGSSKTSVISAYNNLRFHKEAAFTSGSAVVNLTTDAGAKFNAAALGYIGLDVMVKNGASADWTNDLVAVHMFLDGTDVKVQIDALVEASDYRLLAVCEKSGSFTW
jgi:hypothetical protein